MTPEILTIDEVAELLRLTPKAVRIMIDRGQLPGVFRIGKRVRVRSDDLRAYLGLARPSAPNGSARKSA